MATALTIAGSDSGGGAGIQADLKTFAAHGVYGTSALTAVTAQNTLSVDGVFTLTPDEVVRQIDAVAADFTVDAIKTGMLANAAVLAAVAGAIRRRNLSPVVVDPVMVSKSGHHLLSADAIDGVITHLLPLAAVVTPNRLEAEVLTERSIATLDDAREAARILHGRGAAAVVIKGGHFTGPTVVNLLFDGQTFSEFTTPRLDTRNTHGTGCTFASAIAAHLALRRSLPDAIERATTYVAGAMRHGLQVGHGHGPLDHFWMQRPRS
jgi:hydroxymethylpyrimidine/phosphomethylpyrimidine kinase